MKKIIGALLLVGLVWACSSDNGGPTNPPVDGEKEEPKEEIGFERGPMLTNWADNIIIPSYEAFAIEMDELNTSFETFRANANPENLSALRASWLDTYKIWQRVSIFEIGPAETHDFHFSMNTYPTNSNKIDGYVTSGIYDLTLPSNREAKGFPALDYLINGLASDDQGILSRYTAVDNEGLFDYIAAILADMNTNSMQVLAEWKDGYRDTFVSNDGSSATASVDRFTNDFVFYYEKFLRAGKLGIPLGVFSGVQAPATVEAIYSEGLSNELFLEGLSATKDFFNGKYYISDTMGESLSSYLISLERQDLSDDINKQFDDAKVAVDGLEPFSIELQVDPAISMLSAYDEVQKAVSMLKVDMFSAMSISVDYVDADGD